MPKRIEFASWDCLFFCLSKIRAILDIQPQIHLNFRDKRFRHLVFHRQLTPLRYLLNHLIHNLVDLSPRKQRADFFQAVEVFTGKVFALAVQAHPVAVDPAAAGFVAVGEVVGGG